MTCQRKKNLFTALLFFFFNLLCMQYMRMYLKGCMFAWLAFVRVCLSLCVNHTTVRMSVFSWSLLAD